jgi:uncharacterized protein (DUF58 family)
MIVTGRSWRLIALAAPSLIVPLVAQGTNALSYGVCIALAVLWLMLAIVLLVRFGTALHEQMRSSEATSPLDRIDVLTASGAAMMSTGLVALIGSAWTGWASLGVIGVLGVGTVSLSALWTAIVAAGNGLWRRAEVTCSVLPEMATEGDPLREEIVIRSLAIPPGMRLFVMGRAQRHGAVSRYVVDGDVGELKLESELGLALRGEHKAPPLAMWFGDVMGLTRTAVVHRAPAAFTVVPRSVPVDGTQRLLGEGGDDDRALPAHKMPTEGTFRIRTYVPGDDARRIHWVRSLQQDQLIVRLPDEIPPADPDVRLVLDNEMFGTDALTCRAPDEMLDVLVRVWLGIGKALAAQGTRVTLVAALRDGEAVTLHERKLHARSTQTAMRFGSRIGWQSQIALERLVGDRRDKQVIISARPRRVASADIKWVVVPESAWTMPEPGLPAESATRHSYPIGAPENRNDRRLRERALATTRFQDRAIFSQVMCWIDWSRFSGDHVARPNQGRIALEVIP